jgi:hypothetical protein
MNRIVIAVACTTTLMLSGCAFNHAGNGKSAPPTAGVTVSKNKLPSMRKVGSFIVSARLLPKVYNPRNPGWQSFGVGRSALYYVPKSAPTELVEKANGETQVVAKLSCATEGYVSDVGDPYLFVACNAPGGKPEGILADAKTGSTWTLWQGGSVPIGTTYVGGGWAYFWAIAYEDGPVFAQGSVNLETGARAPLPYIMQEVRGPWFAANGAVYGEKFKQYPAGPSTPADLYRMDGLTAMLIAHLPSPPSGIDSNGTIWVSEKGGSLTPNAGSMTIRVWNPVIHASEVISKGPGYVIYRGPVPSLGADGPIRVTLAVPGGLRTITVGEGNVGDTFVVPNALVLPAPHGRWQVVSVSKG